MQYRDLVQFDPIETVIQLRDADDVRAAKELIATCQMFVPSRTILDNHI
jgi:hypothetical protein